jgi:hypothetical protein
MITVRTMPLRHRVLRFRRSHHIAVPSLANVGIIEPIATDVNGPTPRQRPGPCFRKPCPPYGQFPAVQEMATSRSRLRPNAAVLGAIGRQIECRSGSLLRGLRHDLQRLLEAHVSIRMLALVSIAVLAGGWLAGGGEAASATPGIDPSISRSSAVPARIVILVPPIASEPRQGHTAKWRVAITVAECRKLNKGKSRQAKEDLLNCLSGAD